MIEKEKEDRKNYIKELYEKTKRVLFHRQLCYREVFNIQNRPAQLVMEDLAKFCRAHESTFHPDARVQALLEGRKEVWLRIQSHLNLDSETFWKLHNAIDKK